MPKPARSSMPVGQRSDDRMYSIARRHDYIEKGEKEERDIQQQEEYQEGSDDGLRSYHHRRRKILDCPPDPREAELVADMEAGADVNAVVRGHSGTIHRYVHAAVQMRSAPLLRLVVQQPGVLIDAPGRDGGTAAMMAAAAGWVEGAAILLRHRANPFLRDDAGNDLFWHNLDATERVTAARVGAHFAIAAEADAAVRSVPVHGRFSLLVLHCMVTATRQGPGSSLIFKDLFNIVRSFLHLREVSRPFAARAAQERVALLRQPTRMGLMLGSSVIANRSFLTFPSPYAQAASERLLLGQRATVTAFVDVDGRVFDHTGVRQMMRINVDLDDKAQSVDKLSGKSKYSSDFYDYSNFMSSRKCMCSSRYSSSKCTCSINTSSSGIIDDGELLGSSVGGVIAGAWLTIEGPFLPQYARMADFAKLSTLDVAVALKSQAEGAPPPDMAAEAPRPTVPSEGPAEWLKLHGLTQYAEALASGGYATWADVETAEDEDLIGDCGMLKPHARRLLGAAKAAAGA